jgi:acetyltransferase-like isoleucine patch superfamily enzyme
MAAISRYLHLYVYGLLQYFFFIVSYIPSQYGRRWIYQLFGMKLARHTIIYGGAEVRAPWKISIGRYSVVGNKATLDGRGGLEIKECVNISTEVMIWTMQHDHRDPQFAAYSKPVVIEDYAWLGPRVIVLPGVVVAKGCVVAAGAVVTRSTEEYGIYAGIPARRIGERIHTLSYTPGESFQPFI